MPVDYNFWFENFGIAGIFIFGVATGWALCVQILVKPLKERLAKSETRLDRISEKIEDKFWNKS